MSSILKHFPYPQIREVQAQVLETLESNWDRYDVFVITAPTATGKSALAKTIMNWQYSVSYVTPTNMLVNQFKEEFPDTSSLHRMDTYWCEEWRQPCSVTRGRQRKFCKGCECSADLVKAKYKNGPGVYNYHTYLAQALYRKVFVADEAHNIAKICNDYMATVIWQHDYKYPSNIWTVEQIREWANSLPDKKKSNKKIKLLLEVLNSEVPTHVVQRTKEEFNGKGTTRGEPETRDCIKFYSIDPSEWAQKFWPREVEKVVLMSATISKKDIEELGLHKKRIIYINAESPIPVESRPVYIYPEGYISAKNLDLETKKIATFINDSLAPAHEFEKGIIHSTYQMANILKQNLVGPRYLFHDKWNKSEVYEHFRSLPPSSGAILVACGMYEGIDLPEDLGRWQVVAKMPWKSLADPAIRYKAEQDPEWYAWQTIRDLVQATGRICRTPEDYGVTYLVDGSIQRLEQHENLLPEWWLRSIVNE